jgi:hypothetical protein
MDGSSLKELLAVDGGLGLCLGDGLPFPRDDRDWCFTIWIPL